MLKLRKDRTRRVRGIAIGGAVGFLEHGGDYALAAGEVADFPEADARRMIAAGQAEEAPDAELGAPTPAPAATSCPRCGSPSDERAGRWGWCTVCLVETYRTRGPA